MYILDQVRALESEMLHRIKHQGLDITPRILIVTRLLPDAVGTTCNQRLEKVFGTEHSHILRVPFRNEKGIVRKWISRFEVWPYLERYTEVITRITSHESDSKPWMMLELIGTYTDLTRMLQVKLPENCKGSLISSSGTTATGTLLLLC